eukprot:2949459-Pyramimonas_sp.AAC.1
MFNTVKTSADKKSNTVTTPVYAMAKVIDSGMLGTKHSYTEVSRTSAVAPRSSLMSDTAFTPPFRKSKLPQDLKEAQFSEISSRIDPHWYSPGASSYMAPLADVEVLRQADAQNKWEFIGHKLYSRLVQRNVIIKKKHTRDWYLGIGSIEGSVAVGWPLEHDGADESAVHPLRADAKRHLICIFNVDEWEAQPARFVSPLRQAIYAEMKELGGWALPTTDITIKGPAAYGRMTIKVESTSAIKGLWQVAAENGFWDLPLCYLRELCDLRGIEYSSCSLIPVLEALAKNAFPAITSEELVAVMDKRNLHYEDDLQGCEDLCNLDWVVDAFDRESAETMNEEMKSAKATSQSRWDFCADLVKYKAAQSWKRGSVARSCLLYTSPSPRDRSLS